MHKKLFIGLLFLFAFSLCAPSAHAASAIPDPGYLRLQVPIKGVTDISLSGSGISTYLALVYKWLIGFAVALSALMFVIAGFIWLTAGGESGQAKKAQEIIKNTLLGIVLALGSYAILATTNPKLVQPKILSISGVENMNMDFDPITSVGVISSGAPISASAVPTISSSDPSTLLCVSSDPAMQAKKVQNPTTHLWECKMIPINTATKAECEAGDAKPSYTAGNCAAACTAMGNAIMNYAWDTTAPVEKKDNDNKTYYCCHCLIQIGVPGGSTGVISGNKGYRGQPCDITGVSITGGGTTDRKCYDGSVCNPTWSGNYMCE